MRLLQSVLSNVISLGRLQLNLQTVSGCHDQIHMDVDLRYFRFLTCALQQSDWEVEDPAAAQRRLNAKRMPQVSQPNIINVIY